jgi:hypothetical protein
MTTNPEIENGSRTNSRKILYIKYNIGLSQAMNNVLHNYGVIKHLIKIIPCRRRRMQAQN